MYTFTLLCNFYILANKFLNNKMLEDIVNDHFLLMFQNTV